MIENPFNLVPKGFSSRKAAKESFEDSYEWLSTDELERRKLELIVDVLSHPELQKLIEEDKVTLGIIKPNAFEGRGLPENDEEAADFLMGLIGDKAIFSISLKPSSEQVEVFYAPIKDKYTHRIAEDRGGITIWDSIVDFTSSGPLTFVLIYDEDGQAVEWWRDKMGKTRADRAEPESIRGKYAMVENLPNNLVHGSESVEEAKREIGVLKNVLSEILSKSA